jgi:hypothetical protein
MAEIGKIIGLKCPNCGAALPEIDKDLQKCKYCGMTVHIEDANKYLDHLKGFIVEWMRTALPLGVGTAYSSSVDTLARHNIFVHNILPRLSSEFGIVSMNAYEAFSKPLVAPPFVRYPHSVEQLGETKALFSYDAKVAAVQPFAVSAEDQANVEKMGGMTRALAHVMIGLDILKQDQTSSYKTVAENFAVASKALEPRYEVLSRRLNALSEIYLSVDELFSKNTLGARSRIGQAKAVLEDAKAKSAFDINLSICTGAIEEEITVADSIDRIADIMEHSWEGDKLNVLSRIGKFFETTSTISITAPPNWRNKFENLSRYCELVKWFSLILEAKMGKPSVKLVSGPGNILFPFWVSEVRYTFGTGALWMKKGIGVTENALVAATFPLNPSSYSAPSEVVTDIFSNKPYGAFGSSITGTEKSISIGAEITRRVQTARLTSISGYKVVPPLSTVSEAKQIMNEYIKQISWTQQGKLQIASCDIADLLYVPVDLSTGFINFYGTLGNLQPRKVGDTSVINSLLV